MAEILIRGMEMPDTCFECPFMFSRRYCCADLTLDFYGDDGEYTELKGRVDGCPLVALPPHGRLIAERWIKKTMISTLEALKKNPKMDGQEMHLIAAFDTLREMLDGAPTIIPASEEVQDNG